MNFFVQLIVDKINAIIYKNDSFIQISYAKKYFKSNFNFNENISEIISSFRRTKQSKSQKDVYYNVFITNIEFTVKANSTMISAVLFDLIQSDIRMIQQTVYNCFSNNCIWNIFQFLTICSDCTDLTDRFKRSNFRFLIHDTTSTYFNEIVYWFSNDLDFINANEIKIFQILFTTDFDTKNEFQSMFFDSKNTLIWSMILIRVIDSKTLWSHFFVTTIECDLWYCVQNYKFMIKNNNLIEIFFLFFWRNREIFDNYRLIIENRWTMKIEFKINLWISQCDFQII